jgi:hypothetical protein
MQHACRISNSTAVESHINNLLLHLTGLTCISIIEQKCPTLTQLLSTHKPLLTLTSLAVLNNIGALAVRTVEDLYYHCYVELVDVSTSLVKI